MRQLFILIVLVAAGYLGYNFYQERFATKPPESEPAPEVAPAEPAQPSLPPSPAATPAPEFQSKIEMPPEGEKQVAPPGVFYMLERVSIETDTGIRAVIPGEKMMLLKRNDDGTLKLNDGKSDFVVKETQVTNDLQLAVEAERKEWMRRGGKR